MWHEHEQQPLCISLGRVCLGSEACFASSLAKGSTAGKQVNCVSVLQLDVAQMSVLALGRRDERRICRARQVNIVTRDVLAA